MKARLIALSALIFFSLSGCGGADETRCHTDELYDQVNHLCVPRPDPENTDENSEDDPDGDEDQELPDDPEEEEEQEEEDEEWIDPDCDKDGDGYLSYACGGNDCDDNNPDINPGATEICDDVDNNCDGRVNGGLICSFYAHTNDGLYSIDPFLKTYNRQADLVDHLGEPIGLLDIDTNSTGVLYGVTRTALYAFYDTENYWIQVAALSNLGDANGLAIDNDNTAFITAEDHFFRVDLSEIESTLQTHGYDPSRFTSFFFSPPEVTITGGEFYSSGDCVVNKQNTFYMTSKHDPNEDHFVEIDRSTGEAQSIGGLGFKRVYGLTAGWGQIFGATSAGEIISIDPFTAEAELITVFETKRWYGTASTPYR